MRPLCQRRGDESLASRGAGDGRRGFPCRCTRGAHLPRCQADGDRRGHLGNPPHAGGPRDDGGDGMKIPPAVLLVIAVLTVAAGTLGYLAGMRQAGLSETDVIVAYANRYVAEKGLEP